MSKSLQGQKRPAGAGSNAIRIVKVATGEAMLNMTTKRKGGIAGAEARNSKLTQSREREISKLATKVRWRK